ncbi:MAG TPA: orotate phosphoribosyltransferase [Chitinophagales bacterium]|nr:orotate phosphoribosyltransferase [Chitinophagales bacterium]
MENIAFKEKLAEYLLQIKAIQINVQNPFTWTSGWKSPVYCDNRKILSYPDVRTFVKEGFIGLINAYYPQVECIAGVATAGIPHGAIIADALNLPFIYVRSKAKEHGMGNTIEGSLLHGQQVLVIEDTISTGGSSLKAVHDLREAGADILGMLAIYKYGFASTKKRFEDEGVQLKTLTNYDILINAAIKQDDISSEDMETLKLWKQDPAEWHNS